MKPTNDTTSIDISAEAFFRYQGGKQASCVSLVDLMPKQFGAYFEPFLGAASLYFELRNRGFRGPALLGDYNPEIVTVYLAIKSDLAGFLKHYDAHAANDSKAYFEVLRDSDVKGWSLARRAARTVYLAKACYCGLLRTKPDGKFSVHYGDGKACRVRLDPAKVRLASQALWSATICHADFEWIAPLVRKGDLVVADPPYVLTNDRYTAAGFGVEDQHRLARMCQMLTERGAFFLQINSNCGFVRELYGQYRLTEVPPRTAFSCDGKSKQPMGELIITNYDPALGAVLDTAA